MRLNTDIPYPWEIEEEQKKRVPENPLSPPEILPEDDLKEQPPEKKKEERVVIIEL